MRMFGIMEKLGGKNTMYSEPCFTEEDLKIISDILAKYEYGEKRPFTEGNLIVVDADETEGVRT